MPLLIIILQLQLNEFLIWDSPLLIAKSRFQGSLDRGKKAEDEPKYVTFFLVMNYVKSYTYKVLVYHIKY